MVCKMMMRALSESCFSGSMRMLVNGGGAGVFRVTSGGASSHPTRPVGELGFRYLMGGRQGDGLGGDCHQRGCSEGAEHL